MLFWLESGGFDLGLGLGCKNKGREREKDEKKMAERSHWWNYGSLLLN